MTLHYHGIQRATGIPCRGCPSLSLILYEKAIDAQRKRAFDRYLNCRDLIFTRLTHVESRDIIETLPLYQKEKKKAKKSRSIASKLHAQQSV